jgi:thiol-disulfide isomerase/thioredoxin
MIRKIIVLVMLILAFKSFAQDILKDKFGNPVKLPENKLIVLNFVAYSCGYCMAEIPTIKKVLREPEFKNNFVVIAFAMDGKQNNFKDPEFPIYANHPENQVRFPILGTPTTYIITPNGKKLITIYGALTEENFRKYLKEALKKVQSAPGRI